MKYTLCYTVTFGLSTIRRDVLLHDDSVTKVFRDLTASAAAGVVVDW